MGRWNPQPGNYQGMLIKMAQMYSPAFNTITKSAPVTVQLEK
jgi:hypothetical protein